MSATAVAGAAAKPKRRRVAQSPAIGRRFSWYSQNVDSWRRVGQRSTFLRVGGALDALYVH
jgi:hypothetical protein